MSDDTLEQLRRVIETVRSEQDDPQDLRFGALAVSRGFITESQLAEALQQQRELLQQGRPVQLGQILLKRRWIDVDQFVTIVRSQIELTEQPAHVVPEASADRIGKYRVLRPIGRGGMASVYEAEDTRLKRRVALKVIREEEGMNRLSVLRLHREAAIAAQLQHPNIVPIHEMGMLKDGTGRRVHYIAMDFIDGQTLAELLLERRRSRDELLDILEQLARAVGYAHAKGVIHRDLKPGNVLIDRSGRVFLTDFGIARADEFKTQLTHSGTIFGTPQYMSPEQATGRIHEIDARSDVYSLGVIMYEILCGRLPFDSETPLELLDQIVRMDPPRPRTFAIVERDLEIICLKAMAKTREHRYANGEEFAEDLARFRRGDPILARAPSTLYVLFRRFVSRRTSLALVFAVAVAAAVVTGLVISRWFRERAARERTQQQLQVMRDLNTLWGQIVLEKQGLHVAANDPVKVFENLRKGIDLLSDFIQLHPDVPQAYYLRARGHFYCGDLLPAEQDLQAALRLDPEFALAHFLLSRVRLEQFTRNLYLRRQTLSDPRGTHPLLVEALEHLRTGRRAAASLGWDRLTERWGLMITKEDQISDLLTRAVAAAYLDQDSTSAVNLLVEADARDPAAEYCLWLGRWTSGYEEKLRWFNRALDLMPHSVDALFDRGCTRWFKKDWHAMIEDQTRVLHLNPRHAGAFYMRGLAHHNLGHYADAMKDYDMALQLNPRLAQALAARAGIRYLLNDLEGALRDTNSAIAAEADIPEAFVTRGLVHLRNGKPDDALRDLTHALRLDPRHVDGYLTRARLFLQTSNWKAAEEDCSRALQISPERADLYATRSQARLNARNIPGAIEDADAALKLNPNDPEAHLFRAVALASRGSRSDLENALSSLQEALRLGGETWSYRPYALETLRRIKSSLPREF